MQTIHNFRYICQKLLFLFLILMSYSIKAEILVAHYSFDDNWSKSTPLLNSSGHINAVQSRDTVTRIRSPQEGTKPDTNYAGRFRQGSFDINIPNLSKSNIVSVGFWMKWSGSNGLNQKYGVMPIGFEKYDIWMRDGSIGFNTSNSDIWGISSSGLANSWHYISAVFHNDDVTKNQLYIDGNLMTLSKRRSNGASNKYAKISDRLRIGGWVNSFDYGFDGDIDEFKIYEGPIDEDTISQNMGKSTIDHFRLEYNATSFTCEKTLVNVKACADSTCSKLLTNRPVNIQLSNSIDTVSTQITGSANVEIDSIHPQSYTLKITSESGSSANPASCLKNGTADSSCTYSAIDSGFIFNVPTLISSKPSGEISIRAARQGSSGNQCIAALSGKQTVDFKLRYLSTFHNKATTDISGTAVSESKTPVTLNFNSEGVATFNATHKQAGKMALDVALTLKPGQKLQGSDEFVSKPLALFLLPYLTTVEQATCPSKDASCSVYTAAGNNFTLQAKAVQWVSDADKDFSDNPAIEGFVLDDIRVTHSLVAPADGDPGTIPDVRFNYTNHQGLHNINGLSVSEVGVFEFDLQPPLYFGQRISTVKTPPMGRFTPSYFTLQVDRGEFENQCSGFRYTGQAFNYEDPPRLVFKAYSLGDPPALTKNYHGEFAKILTTHTLTVDSIIAPVVDGTTLALTTNVAATKGQLYGEHGHFVYHLSTSAIFNYPHTRDNFLAPATRGLSLKFLELRDSDNIPILNHRTKAPISMPFLVTPSIQPELRFGRIHIENNHGSELEDLPISITARYFDGLNWVVNTDDQCTQIDFSRDLRLTGNVASKATLIDNKPMNKGQSILLFAPPEPTSTGSIDITSHIAPQYPWLLNDFNSDGKYEEEIKGRATFGTYKKKADIIYWRELY